MPAKVVNSVPILVADDDAQDTLLVQMAVQRACLGLQLARAEARIALGALLSRMTNIALAPDAAVEWLSNDFLRGPVRLPLLFPVLA